MGRRKLGCGIAQVRMPAVRALEGLTCQTGNFYLLSWPIKSHSRHLSRDRCKEQYSICSCPIGSRTKKTLAVTQGAQRWLQNEEKQLNAQCTWEEGLAIQKTACQKKNSKLVLVRGLEII